MRSRLRDVPWVPFAAGLGGIGAAHLIGHMSGASLGVGVSHIPAVRNWLKDPRNRKNAERIVRAGIIATGTGASLAALGTHLAHQKRMAEAFHDAHSRLEQKDYGEKTASLLNVYSAALELL